MRTHSFWWLPGAVVSRQLNDHRLAVGATRPVPASRFHVHLPQRSSDAPFPVSERPPGAPRRTRWGCGSVAGRVPYALSGNKSRNAALGGTARPVEATPRRNLCAGRTCVRTHVPKQTVSATLRRTRRRRLDANPIIRVRNQRARTPSSEVFVTVLRAVPDVARPRTIAAVSGVHRPRRWCATTRASTASRSA
jgi:hypothetical protein